MECAVPTNEAAEPIAIVGFSFKFGGEANNAQNFWEMLLAGRCAVTDVPPDRFNAEAFYHPDTNRLDTLPVKQGNFLKDNIAAFDAPFFSIKAAEAAAMDPQSRALLETTYRALENAGIPIDQCAGSRTCVYTGISADDYRLMYVKDVERPIRHAATGMAISMLANKISWFYDFKGPSAQIDTACSASLNALHLACQSIRSGQSTMGVVGGANMFFTPESMAPLAHLNFFSSDARCYSFDRRANGYSRGEGFGVLILKPLSRAVADGDPIRAIVRATGSNENGRTAGGITKVNREAQQCLIRETYLNAGLDFSSTRYAEAHGPGTEGDIVETSAFGSVFRSHRTTEDALYVGSVKANVGHLEGTSGIASLVKVILMLEKGVIPRLANFEHLHSRILAEEWRLRFPMENLPWPPGLRRASINSFGFGGSNAHVVLDGTHEHPLLYTRTSKTAPVASIMILAATDGIAEKESGQASLRHSKKHSELVKSDKGVAPRLLVWSTADEGGMQRLAYVYSQYLSQVDDGGGHFSNTFLNLAYTLAARRSRLPWSSFVIARSWADLQGFESRLSKPVRSVTEPKLALIFNGQGAQYAKMAQGLLEDKVFHSSLETCQQHLQKLGAFWDIVEEISKLREDSRLQHAEYSQTTCTALQIALIDLLRSHRIVPLAVLGHSSGEIAAAYAVGALSAESAVRVAFYRGVLAAKVTGKRGELGMMAVGLSEQEARSQLLTIERQVEVLQIDVGCINSPTNVTLTGNAKQLDLLNVILAKQSIFTRKLDVNVAYHSPFMKSVSSKYKQLIGKLEGPATAHNAPHMYSAVTTAIVSVEELRTAEYWVKNLESPVLFAPALKEMISEVPSIRALVEIGPHGVLRTAIKDTLEEITKGNNVHYISTLDRNKHAADAVLESVGKLHCLGYPVDLSQAIGLEEGERPECLTDLPEYPFDHSKTYWHESRLSKNHRFRRYARNDLLGSRVFDWNPLQPRWRNIIKTLENPWIEDHRIGGALIYPGAGMLVMAIEATAQYMRDVDTRPIAGFMLKEVSFLASLNISLLPEGTETEIRLAPGSEKLGRSAAPAHLEFQIYVLENEQWTETCRGRISAEFVDDESTYARAERLHGEEECLRNVRSRTGTCTSSLKNQKLYERFKSFGLDFGPTFQVFENVRFDPSGGMAAAEIKLTNWKIRGNPAHSTPYIVHPTALDGALQLPVVALGAGATRTVPTMVPSRIASIWVSGHGLASNFQLERVAAVAKAEYRGFRGTISEVLAIDPESLQPRIVIEGLETVIIKSRNEEQAESSKNLCFRMDWKPDLDMIAPEELKWYCQGTVKEVHKIGVTQSDGLLPSGKDELHDLRVYLATLTHKNPALRMLEIASPATGDVSQLVLWRLLHCDNVPSDTWEDSFESYDISLQGAPVSQDLRAMVDSMSNDKRIGIRTINGTKSTSNGRKVRPHHNEPAAYDLVLAVLDEDTVISETKTLLRLVQPDGRLAVVVGNAHTSSSRLGSTAWLRTLATANKTVEMELSMCCNARGSHSTNEHSVLVLVFKVIKPPLQVEAPRQAITLLKMPGDSSGLESLVDGLQSHLRINEGDNVIVMDWEEVSTWENDKEMPDELHFVCLSVLNSKSLRRAGEDAFLTLKALASRGKSVLWVTCVLQDSECPDSGKVSPAVHGTASGLCRTIRTECPDKIIVTLALDPIWQDEMKSHAKITDVIGVIAQVLKQMRSSTNHDYEPEYHYGLIGGIRTLQIPRLHRSQVLNEHLSTILALPETTIAPFNSHRDVTLTITNPGLLDTLTFIPSAPRSISLPPNHLLIRPQYVGLNFLDLLTALGRIPQIDVLGVEASGIVLSAGSQSDLHPGDRVTVLTDGTLRSIVSAHYQTAIKISNELSFCDAASIPGTACTVYRALVDVAHLQEGESVLIHAGAGATGQMAIQLAQYLGAEVYVTVGSERKKQLVVDTWGVNEENVFHSRDKSFAAAVKRSTAGRGVDVVLNSLAGELLEVGWEETVAPFGRWVELGKRDIIDGTKLRMTTFLKNVTFSCVDLSGIWRERPAMMRKLLENVFRLVKDGHLKVVEPIREFGVGDVEGAMRSLQNGQEGGKVVIRMAGDEEVKMVLPRLPGWSFRQDRTYVICGGLGGLGRDVARWMVNRGAKHLVLISRGGVGRDQLRQALVRDLETTGCKVLVPKLDIADRKGLQALLQQCATILPPIAGCIQASMVLRDVNLADMTIEDWTTSTNPKVSGSWNLHSLLPTGLDFFILFSSIVGIIGGPGQGNYAAGNVFQDALAQYRESIGEKAVSLDLGMIVDAGAVAEDEKLTKALQSSGWYRPLNMRELEGLLEICCNPESKTAVEQEGSQLICGLELPATMRANGHKEPAWMGRPVLRQLHVLGQDERSSGAQEHAAEYRTLFETADSLKAAGAIVTEVLVKKLSASLAIPTTDIDTAKPMHFYGVDSLVALELRNWFSNELAADVAVFDLLGNASCEAIGLLAARNSAYKQDTW